MSCHFMCYSGSALRYRSVPTLAQEQIVLHAVFSLHAQGRMPWFGGSDADTTSRVLNV